jgi:hypothetical protein
VIEERLLGLQGQNEIAQAGLTTELRVDQVSARTINEGVLFGIVEGPAE